HVLLTMLVVDTYAAAVIGRLRSFAWAFVGAIIVGLASSYATGYIPTGNRYFTNFRTAVPVLLLFAVLLLLPQARLRGHRAARTRESRPMPTWRGSVIAAAAL